jgi:hypothetical protein
MNNQRRGFRIPTGEPSKHQRYDTCAGAAVEFDSWLDGSLLRFLVGGIAVTAGLVWLWRVLKEWRSKSRLA